MNTSKAILVTGLLFSAVLFISGCNIFGDNSSDVTISMEELPASIRSSAQNEINGCQIKEVEKEMKKGKLIYAITYYDKEGILMEIEYAEDGRLLFKGKE